MVYRRRKSFRRRKRRFGGRRGSYKRMKKVIRRTVNNMAETHSLVISLSSPFSSISTAWVENILIPSQGGLSTQIVARRYEITGFSLFGTVTGGQANTSADDKYNTLRIVAAVFDGDAASLAPTAKWPTLVQGTSTPIRLRNPVYPVDGSTQMMRRKLKDKLFTLVSDSRDSTGYMPAVKSVGMSYRFKKPLVINYCNESGTLKPDKYVAIGMVSDSSLVPSVGFIAGALTWFWKDI